MALTVDCIRCPPVSLTVGHTKFPMTLTVDQTMCPTLSFKCIGCTIEPWSWSKLKRRARTSVSTILERKSSARLWVLVQWKMLYQPTEFRKGSDGFNRWLTHVRALISKQVDKTNKDIRFHHLRAEIVCWILSPHTVQGNSSTHQILPRQ